MISLFDVVIGTKFSMMLVHTKPSWTKSVTTDILENRHPMTSQQSTNILPIRTYSYLSICENGGQFSSIDV